MTLIINLTQHPSTPEQQAAGVVDLKGNALEALKDALTFNDLPTADEIRDRAELIADLAIKNGLGDEYDDPIPDAALIGGALWLMGPLAEELRLLDVKPLFAFSTREVKEQAQPDGSVRKVAVFKHRGFVEAV